MNFCSLWEFYSHCSFLDWNDLSSSACSVILSLLNRTYHFSKRGVQPYLWFLSCIDNGSRFLSNYPLSFPLISPKCCIRFGSTIILIVGSFLTLAVFTHPPFLPSFNNLVLDLSFSLLKLIFETIQTYLLSRSGYLNDSNHSKTSSYQDPRFGISFHMCPNR